MATGPPNSVPPPELQPIFVADASAEADRLRAALEQAGYPAVDVPLGLLVSRVSAQSPRLLMLDPEPTRARDAVLQLALLGRGAFPIVLLGECEWSDDHAVGIADVLARPLNLHAAIALVERLIGPPPDATIKLRAPWRTSPPEEYRATPSERRPSSPPAVSDAPSDEPDDADRPAEAHTKYSSDLEDLLEQAERRLQPRDDEPRNVSRRGKSADLLVDDSMLAGLDGELVGAGGATRNPSEPPRDDSAPSRHQTGTAAEELTGVEVAPEIIERSPSGSPSTNPPASNAVVTSADRSRTAATIPPRVLDVTGEMDAGSSPGSLSTAVMGRDTKRPIPGTRSEDLTGVDELRRAMTVPPTMTHAPPGPEPTRDVFGNLSSAVSSRFTGCLVQESSDGMRRIVMRDGDFCVVASAVRQESIMAYLSERGDMSPDVAAELERKLPNFGRHAGAGLVAHGAITPDQLWATLRGHSEWLLRRALVTTESRVTREREVPDRLAAEPAIFGGATGAEVLVSLARHSVAATEITALIDALGGPLRPGGKRDLLGECALSDVEHDYVVRSLGTPVDQVVRGAPNPDFPRVLFALVQLGVVAAERRTAPTPLPPSKEADTERPRARAARVPPPLPAPPPESLEGADPSAGDRRREILEQHALVEDGDYFAVLQLPPTASADEIHEAYVSLRRRFEPSRVLCADTADLDAEVDAIGEVLGEAYEVLRDDTRRQRYRRALS